MGEKTSIIAKDIESFKKVDDLIKELPECVSSQIETAEGGSVGISCTLRQQYCDEPIIYLPNTTTQIQPFGDYIGVYCGAYFFKITGKLMKKPIKYLFTPVGKK